MRGSKRSEFIIIRGEKYLAEITYPLDPKKPAKKEYQNKLIIMFSGIRKPKIPSFEISNFAPSTKIAKILKKMVYIRI